MKPAEVKWHTLLKGLEAARKDGYELVVWSGPATGTQRISYRSTSGTAHLQTSSRGFVYVVRGYRSNTGPPTEERPVGALIDQVNGMLASGKL